MKWYFAYVFQTLTSFCKQGTGNMADTWVSLSLQLLLVWKLKKRKKEKKIKKLIYNFSMSTSSNRRIHVLYISTSVWVLHTPNAGWNSHFQHFKWQKA